MAQSPPGWMQISHGSQDIGPVDDPEYWQQALTWAETIVQHWSAHPALHSWILWNEASRVLSQQDDDARRASSMAAAGPQR